MRADLLVQWNDSSKAVRDKTKELVLQEVTVG